MLSDDQVMELIKQKDWEEIQREFSASSRGVLSQETKSLQKSTTTASSVSVLEGILKEKNLLRLML